MADKYTVYPEALRKKIDKVNKMFEDEAKEKERWAALTPDQQRAETQEAERWNGLTQEQQEAEIKEEEDRLAGLSNEAREAELKERGIVPAPVLAPEPESIESLKAKLDKSDQALSTLKGKYEKEPTELARQNSFLVDQMGVLQRQVEDLKAQIKPKEIEPAAKKIVFREVMKKRIESMNTQLAPDIVEEIVAFGEESFNLGQETTQEAAKQLISEVVVKYDGKLALTAKEKFDKDLIEKYPNWKTMWKTPEFQTFLSFIPEDDLSGLDRFAFIDDAFKRNDSRTVLKAFDLFTGKKPEAPGGKPTLDPAKLKNRIYAPRTSGPGGEVKPITNKMSPQEARAALTALTGKYSRGQFRGTKAEYDKEYAKLHSLCEQKPSG